MKFTPTALDGVFEIDLDYRGDDRGFFARTFCKEEFAQVGIKYDFVQVNNSASTDAATLRGLHYQIAPHGEAKLLRCISGSVFDVALDLRQNSPTFGKWHGVTLTAQNRKMILVPEGCAHGFLTLEPNSEVFYFASCAYHGPSERIVRWDDPQFAISWPEIPKVLSEKDANAIDFDRVKSASGY